MEGLNDALGDDRPGLLAYAATLGFACGVCLVGIGTLSVVYDATAAALGASVAVRLAPALTVAALATGLAAVAVAVADRPATGRLGVGLGLAYAGAALAWVVVPAGWTGAMKPVFFLPAGTAVVGLLLLATLVASVLVETERSDVSRPADFGTVSGDRPGSATVADGGDDEETLTFLLDGEDDDEREQL